MAEIFAEVLFNIFTPVIRPNLLAKVVICSMNSIPKTLESASNKSIPIER